MYTCNCTEYVCVPFNVVGPNITSSPMKQLVVSPGDTTFTCVAEGLPRPTIGWFITDPSGTLVELPRDDPQLSIEDTTGPGDRVTMSVISITNILPFLGVTYTCVVSNEVDTQVAAANLTVLSKCKPLWLEMYSMMSIPSPAVPEIVAPPEGLVLTVNQFQPVTFTCAAAGTPLPEISWIRQINGEDFTLVAGDSIAIEDPVVTAEFILSNDRGVVMGVSRSLTLMRVLDEDSGRYFCIANSTTGEDTRGFDLVVQGESAIVFLCGDEFTPLSIQLLLTLLILLMTPLRQLLVLSLSSVLLQVSLHQILCGSGLAERP